MMINLFVLSLADYILDKPKLVGFSKGFFHTFALLKEKKSEINSCLRFYQW